MKRNYHFKSISNKKIWDSENVFYLKTNISRWAKAIYHYEIYKKILGIPGDIVELGVFKGNSIVRFATYRSILENNNSRKIIGFDNFGKFTNQRRKEDKFFINKWNKTTGGRGIDVNELKKIFEEKKFSNFELIKGNINKTLALYLKKNSYLKISLLHLDLDVYSPTLFALRKLYKYVSKGGVVLIDDYATVKGATEAVDIFVKKYNIKLKKKNFLRNPSYFIKE